MTELSKSGPAFSLFPSFFCVQYIVISNHPPYSLVGFDFLRVMRSMDQELGHKNHRVSPFLLPIACMSMEEN